MPGSSTASHFALLVSLFRFSLSPKYLCELPGVPFAYHIPRVSARMRLDSPGLLKTVRERNMDVHIRLTQRRDCDKEGGGDNRENWAREPMAVEFFVPSLASPRLLRRYFHVLTSVVDCKDPVTGQMRRTRSRFFCAPVLTGEFNRKENEKHGTVMENPTLNVFSVCFENSDLPEHSGIPRLEKPQRIVDAGTANARLWDDELSAAMAENLGSHYRTAESAFLSGDWSRMVMDKKKFGQRKAESFEDYYFASRGRSYATQRTENSLFIGHRYDCILRTYLFMYGGIFAYRLDGNKTEKRLGDGKIFMFLDPSHHFQSEEKLWGLYVEIWKREMLARYGPGAVCKLVRPEEYFEEGDEPVEEWNRYVGRWELKPPRARRKRERPQEESDERVSSMEEQGVGNHGGRGVESLIEKQPPVGTGMPPADSQADAGLAPGANYTCYDKEGASGASGYVISVHGSDLAYSDLGGDYHSTEYPACDPGYQNAGDAAWYEEPGTGYQESVPGSSWGNPYAAWEYGHSQCTGSEEPGTHRDYGTWTYENGDPDEYRGEGPAQNTITGWEYQAEENDLMNRMDEQAAWDGSAIPWMYRGNWE